MFGLGINKLGSSRSQASATPETLFYAGEEGTFLDFTASQVYADTAGTDPAEVGEGTALVLGKSQGGVARRNLLTYTDEFDNAVWDVSSVATISANTEETTAPDGTNTADKLIETAVTNNHFVRRIDSVIPVSSVYTLSCYAKKGTRDFISLSESGTNRTWFNISTGTIGTVNAAHSASISSVGDGWYRCAITFTAAASFPYIYLNSANGQTVYAGSVENFGYIWGAQLETGSTATEYQKITTGINGEWTPGTHSTQATSTARPIFARVPVGGRRNLLERTEEFDNAYWVPNGDVFTVLANDETSPAESVTADKLRLAAGQSATQPFAGRFLGPQVFRSASPIVLTANSYTVSVYAKAGEYDHCQLRANTSTSIGSGGNSILVDLRDGSVVGTEGGTGAAESLGGGWYRISLTFTGTAVDWYFGFRHWNSTSIASANGTDGIYIWGAQLEVAA